MLEDLSTDSVDTPLHICYNNTVYTRRVLHKTFFSSEVVKYCGGYDSPLVDWLDTEEGQWCKQHSKKLIIVSQQNILLNGTEQVIIGYLTDKHWTVYLLKFK